VLKGDKYFELLETVKPPEVIRVYKNRSSSLIYLTRLVNKGFALSLTFSPTPILTSLGVLSDTLFNRRSHDNALVALEIQSLFQLDRANTAQ
jgi:hypothetical protein